MLLKLSSLPIGLGCIKAHPGGVQEAIANYRGLSLESEYWLVKAILSKAMELRVFAHGMMPGTIRIRMRKDSLTEVEPIQFLG